ncbi:MAG TPA: response regulator [Patescibacteria group bacterium]|nr:response regulator [Patescibacteria group bacterium]
MNKNKRTILFVEDENDLVDVYHLMFDDSGYNFLSTKDIDEAMMLCEREKIDLVLLDILLPAQNGEIEKMGFVFLAKLKANLKTKKIPVIIFTNLSSIKDKKEGMRLGAEDYLLKTERTPQQLLAEVKEILK